MSAVAIEQDAWEPGHHGPVKFATQLATYISDPQRIRLLTVREFGVTLSPSVERCAELRADYLRRCELFRSLSEGEAENDNGAHYQVPGLVKPVKAAPKPKPAPKPAPPKIDRRLAVLAKQRDRHEEIRRQRAVSAGPIAREVILKVAEFFLLEPYDILGHGRQAYIVSARYVAARLLFEVKDANGKPRFSRSQVGRLLGGREHTTILHTLENFDKRARKHPLMADAYKALTA